MVWNSLNAGGAGPPLPSLNGLCAFDAVARHHSMTRAAGELCVTQTAVSHQIRRLEAELGTALFRRARNRLELTPEGEVWASQLGPLFARLRATNQRLRQGESIARETLTLSVIPSFCSRWLIPRLSEYLHACPDLQLRVIATERLVDLELEDVDLAIRYGRGRYPGAKVIKLAGDAFIPVATPAYVKRAKLKTPQDLCGVDLLRDDYPDAWERWFQQVNVPPSPLKRVVEYTESADLVEAALLGQGIALCRVSLVSDALRSRRLVRLFKPLAALPCELSYYVVCSARATTPAANHFVAWLLHQARSLAEVTR